MATHARSRRALHWIAFVVLLVAAIGTQTVINGAFERFTPMQEVQWVRSPGVMRRLVLGFNSVAADIYWIRAVQYYGSTKLSKAENKDYGFLFPLLDITTTLDPRFNIAYRFGAILLSEGYPNGPGRPDEAIALLEKGIQRIARTSGSTTTTPGSLSTWWRRRSTAAADWFLRGSKLPTAPNWLQPLAASVLAEGGDQLAARVLWTQMAQTAEQEWMRRTARTRLQQLDAEAVIGQLQPIVNSFYDKANRFPTGWDEMIRAGLVRGDPARPDRRSLHAGSRYRERWTSRKTQLSIPCGAACERRNSRLDAAALCGAVRGLHRKLSERLHLPAAAR